MVKEIIPDSSYFFRNKTKAKKPSSKLKAKWLSLGWKISGTFKETSNLILEDEVEFCINIPKYPRRHSKKRTHLETHETRRNVRENLHFSQFIW